MPIPAIVVAVIMMCCSVLRAQDLYDGRWSVGAASGLALGVNETQYADRQWSPTVKAFGMFDINKMFAAELDVAYAKLSSDRQGGYSDYLSHFYHPNLRLRYYPIRGEFNPYVGVGLGLMLYNVDSMPFNAASEALIDGTVATGVVMAGLNYAMTDNWSVDLNVSAIPTFSDDINPVRDDQTDGYWAATLGISYSFGSADTDRDRDQLLNSEEVAYGTNPDVADTDTDRLDDGPEVKTFETNPLNPDTDRDGLTDGDEVDRYRTDPKRPDTDEDLLSDGKEVNSHKTNPLSKDTDADGLADGVEVNTYRTNPRNADSDNDGLRDGDEVNVYYTDPNNRDTDADGLLDGDEVRRYNTNPRDADTDKGTLRDGDEIARKKNPLDPADDIDRPMPRLELGKKVVMQGIMFETGKATILPESETVLRDVLRTLSENPAIEVLIGGHTDNVGSVAINDKLSHDRAKAVRDWLVDRGVSTARMQVEGYGASRPIVPNDTEGNRHKNRRIEFERIK